MFQVHIARVDNFVFKRLYVFSLGWRVGFTIFNRRKTDKKQEMALPLIKVNNYYVSILKVR
jgi:hypothetical protein